MTPESPIDAMSCKGIPSTLGQLFVNSNGHQLLHTTNAHGLHYAFCARCGKNGSVKPRHLLAACPGHLNKRPQSIKALFKQPPRHFNNGERLTAPVMLLPTPNGLTCARPSTPATLPVAAHAVPQPQSRSSFDWSDVESDPDFVSDPFDGWTDGIV